MAFAIFADLQIDTRTGQWTDGGCDFDVLIGGARRRIDIKTAQNEPYALMVKADSKPADYYVLAHADGNTVELIGGAPRTAVEDGQYRHSENGHYNDVLPVAILDPLPEPETVTSP